MAKVKAKITAAKEFQAGQTILTVELDDSGAITTTDIVAPSQLVATKPAAEKWLGDWLTKRLADAKSGKDKETILKTISVEKDKP